MKKYDFISLLVLFTTLVIGACSSPSAEPTATLAPIVENPIVPDTPTPAASCSSVPVLATPMPAAASVFPPATRADFSLGPVDAAVTIIQYCDFQSTGCKSMHDTLARLRAQYGDDLRVIFRPVPLPGVTDKAEQTMLAAFAADEQEKFWEMHDLLFSRYGEWASLTTGEFDAWIVREALSAGVDADQLRAAMNSPVTADRLQSTHEAMQALGVPVVPIVLINGIVQQAYVFDYQSISDTVGLILLGKKQFTVCPPFDIDPATQYVATIETEKGNIVIELLPNKAPLAVNSFVFLARQGWFDGVTFHRVIPGFAAQAGDPSGTGRGNPGYIFENEISDLRFDAPGLVGMANSGPDTNGSQFFITFAPAEHLNGAYTIFGRVLSGLDTAERLTPRDPAQGANLPAGDKIIRITITEN